MIRVAVLYPVSEGSRFDIEYYRSRHLSLVERRLDPVNVEFDEGRPDLYGNPPVYYAISYLIFDSMDHLKSGYCEHGRELTADIINFTDIDPIIQVSDIRIL